MKLPGRLVALVSATLLVLGACSSGDDDDAQPTAERTTTTTTEPGRPLATRLCDGARPAKAGTIADSELIELSGLAASHEHPGILWANNDSGDSARVFAFDRTGAARGRFAITGAEAFDWEDIALQPTDDGDLLYAADIGDNAEARSKIVIYRFPAPEPTTADSTATASVGGVGKIRLRYPDGAHDAEALLVDPEDGDIVIVSKEYAGEARIFTIEGPVAASEDVQTLTDAGPLDLGLVQPVTSGDVSSDGSAIAIRTYPAIWMFARDLDETIAHALATKKPCKAKAAVEQQGEAIAIDTDLGGYATVSEGKASRVLHSTADAR